MESVSKMLGHTCINMTMKYARIADRLISEDMQRLEGKSISPRRINLRNSLQVQYNVNGLIEKPDLISPFHFLKTPNQEANHFCLLELFTK
jgi:hypothetical protein